jgi:hypothetical protein
MIETSESRPGFIEKDNLTAIEQFGSVSVLGTIPYSSALRGSAPSYSTLPAPVVAEMEKIANQLRL